MPNKPEQYLSIGSPSWIMKAKPSSDKVWFPFDVFTHFFHISFTFHKFHRAVVPWCRGAVGLIFPLGVPVGRHIDERRERCGCERREQRHTGAAASPDPCRHGVLVEAEPQWAARHSATPRVKKPYLSYQNIEIELVVSCINPSNIWAWRTHYTLSGGLSLDPQPSIKDTNCLRLMGSDQQRGVLIQFYPPGTQTIETCSWLHQGPTETEHHRNMK